jgi:transcriptional regulator with PAS, ATPase and Fis domain
MNGNNSFDQPVSRPQFSVAQPNTSDSNPIVLPQQNNNQPVFINDKSFEEHETIDESLSILDKEKELILKALKKHRNKRKDAATDLGISERTLYRKIKEYDIDI